MYPYFFFPFTEFKIYTFWLWLSLSFIAFIYMLRKMSKKTGVNQNFFAGNALLFVGSTFLFSRLFFIISEWSDYKYLIQDRIVNFFLMTDYNLSFIWGVFGFLLVLIYLIYRHQQSHEKYIDVIVVSFFFAAIIGYLAALLGGQIYGKPTGLPIGIVYQGEDMNIPYTSAVIPLALFYSLLSFTTFTLLYIAKELNKIPGFIGYMGIGIFSIILLVGEFFSGAQDIFHSFIGINLTQVGAIVGIFTSGLWLFRKIGKIK